MALTWTWENKSGEAIFMNETDEGFKEFAVSLYEGNAYLIFIYEYKDKDTGDDMYNLQGFFTEKTHMKRCLGIDKKWPETYGHNTYNKKYSYISKLRLNKDKCRNYKDIVAAFIEAFPKIEIEIYSEPKEEVA